MHDEQQLELLALGAVPSLAALLRHAIRNMPGDVHPDGVRVTLDVNGLEVDFLAGDVPVGGLGFDA